MAITSTMVGLMVATTRLPHLTRTALAAATSGISDLRVGDQLCRRRTVTR